jgi:phosphoglycerol transferase MdoB-like AlkP superfamily enzyme
MKELFSGYKVRQMFAFNGLNKNRRSFVVLLACLMVLVALSFLWEGNRARLFDFLDLIRLGLIFLVLASLFLFLTGRVISSLCFSLSTILVLSVVSKVKFAYVKSTLHSLDFVVHLLNPSEIIFFALHYNFLALGVLLLIFVIPALSIYAMRFEVRDNKVRWYSLSAVLVFSICLAVNERFTVRRDYRTSFDAFHMSAFFTSLPDAFDYMLGRDEGFELTKVPLQHQQETAFAKGPNIIAILHESISDPRILGYDDAENPMPDQLFRSGDGKSRKLHVETWGGVTWLSEYGFNLGISTYSFGDLRGYLANLISDRPNASIARVLSDIGYSTTALFPLSGEFTNSRVFYKSMGYENFFDKDDLGAPSSSVERDQFYYTLVLKDLEARRKRKDQRPTFHMVWTLATHRPYLPPKLRDVRSSEVSETDELKEYGRLMRVAEDDLGAFMRELQTRFPDEQFLIVGFGDHQSIATGPLIGIHAQMGGAPDGLRFRQAYETFFYLEGVNFKPHYERLPDEIEIALLSTAVLTAADLPLDDAFRLREKALHECAGLLHWCPDSSIQQRLYDGLRKLVQPLQEQ